MNLDETLRTIQELRRQRAELYKYWQKSKRKIRPSERAMTLATYDREIETLDRVITILLNMLAENKSCVTL